MKSFKLFQILCFVVLMASSLSCTDERIELPSTNELLGVWERSDASEEFEYTLHFISDERGNWGQKGVVSKNLDNDTVLANAISFDWSSDNNVLTLDLHGEIIETEYSFDKNGNLHFTKLTELTDYSDLYFVRVE